jgi:DNA repair exonuclease SbcCD nuclease subunit
LHRQFLAIIDICKKIKIDFVVFLGDYYDDVSSYRKTLMTDTFAKVKEELANLSVPLLFVKGNHDSNNENLTPYLSESD